MKLGEMSEKKGRSATGEKKAAFSVNKEEKTRGQADGGRQDLMRQRRLVGDKRELFVKGKAHPGITDFST